MNARFQGFSSWLSRDVVQGISIYNLEDRNLANIKEYRRRIFTIPRYYGQKTNDTAKTRCIRNLVEFPRIYIFIIYIE